MEREPRKCVRCGSVVPPRVSLCPCCGYESVDRDVWYHRYAPEIVGGLLGAALAVVTVELCVPYFLPTHSIAVYNALYDLCWLWALIGGAVGVATARRHDTGPILSA